MDNNITALPTKHLADQMLNVYYNIILMKETNVDSYENITDEMIKQAATLFCLSLIDKVEYDFGDNLTFTFILKNNLPTLTMEDSVTFTPERNCDEIFKFLTILTRSGIVELLEKEQVAFKESKLVKETLNVIDLNLRRKKK